MKTPEQEFIDNHIYVGTIPSKDKTNKKPSNLWAKTRKVDNPYLLVTDGDWTWAVLKAYKSRKAELKDPYARWFCAVSSPYTHGEWEFGDVYCIEIPLNLEASLTLDDRLIQEAL